VPATGTCGGTATGEPTGIWGASLVTWSGRAGSTAGCRHCGAELGCLSAGWEGIAGRVSLSPEDLGRDVRIHESLTAVAYVCPHCVTALWVDTEPAGGKDWQDFALHT
jgi:N-methylhydantoinase B